MEGMASRRPRDAWTEFVRRRAAELGAWLARRILRRAERRDQRAAAAPRPAATPAPGPFSGLRYYPAFVVLCMGSFLLVAGPLMRLLIDALDQVLVPRLHPVDLRPGDVIEVGSSGGYRPVRVRHTDGSVTDHGEMAGYLGAVRVLPVVLPVGVGWLLGVYGLARRWPRSIAAPAGAPDTGREMR
jgi:hypothetical protein